MPLVELSKVLSTERQALECLLFKLEEVQLIASAGRHEWLASATEELRSSLVEVHRQEELRQAAVAAAAASLGLAAGITLGELADAAPEPWDEVLRAHRGPLIEVMERIQRISLEGRQVIARRLEVAESALSMLGELPLSGYDPGGSVARRRRPHLVNEAV
ncbi:MAG: flagellar export chaperone FlgN [Acidimicrobiales bacterium]